MARREVIEVKCDRCGRVETQGSEDRAVEGPEVNVTFHGETYVYDDLCKRCRSAVRGYFDRIAKKADDQISSDDSKVTSIDPASETSERKRFFGGG